MGKTRKKAAARSGALPDLLVFVPCDLVSRDPNSGKVTIYGIFDQFVVATLPAPVQFSIFAKLAGGRGAHRLIVEVVGPDGRKFGPPVDPFTLDCNPGERYDIQIRVSGVEIEQYGVHQIRLRAGNSAFGEPYLVEVVRRKSSPSSAETLENPSVVKSKSRRRLSASDVEHLLDDDIGNEHLLVGEERNTTTGMLQSILFSHGPSFTLNTLADLCEQESESEEGERRELWRVLKRQLDGAANKAAEIDIESERPPDAKAREQAADELKDALDGHGPLFVVSTLATLCEHESEDPKDLRGQDPKNIRSYWKALAGRLRRIQNAVPPELDQYG